VNYTGATTTPADTRNRIGAVIDVTLSWRNMHLSPEEHPHELSAAGTSPLSAICLGLWFVAFIPFYLIRRHYDPPLTVMLLVA